MKKIIVCFFTLLSIVSISAQENTAGMYEDTAKIVKASVLVIPFESKMYLSDIDRNLAQNHQMNFQEIKGKFRAALDRAIFIELKKDYDPLSFYVIPSEESRKELGYIYSSIGYKYELVPEEVVVKKENIGTKLLGKFKKSKKKEEYIDAGIQGGQIVSEIDNRERYMKTKVVNEKLLSSLNTKFSASYYIFINQLDIKRGADMRYTTSNKTAKREIKVHYTIFDAMALEVSSGAIKTKFSPSENDIDKIIKIQFPLIAQQMVKNLIGTEITAVE